ncbi:expressed unknown protein [Seminavis robusta]|uniref:Magnesium-dependent phosphatase-1 n=1 Tax=Seminavis robusta TaxID=568900 RepID=A0A9N8DUZ6_9STRA|nr:expressed unknown protein [Seminavis robusta]|eukprot:Sro391_g133130.1 n/a (241) ;mRNA; r:41907-43045
MASFCSRDPHLPSMIVFDLDDCLWSPEMHELYAKPTVPVHGILNPHKPPNEQLQGVVGLSNQHGDTVTLYEGARRAMYELVTNPEYQGVIIAVASTSLEPSYSHACLQGLEVLPGKTLRHVIQYDQIGRTGKLTSRKTTHFRELHKESGIPYEEMLFFDDCNWGDHVGDIDKSFGVIGQRTPNGLQWHEFQQALGKYKQRALEATEKILNMSVVEAAIGSGKYEINWKSFVVVVQGFRGV